MDKCTACGTELKDGGHVGVYCPNRDCPDEKRMRKQIIRAFRRKKQRELLLECLAEECAEVIQIKSKIARFGSEDSHPSRPDKTNKDLLNKEVGDLMTVIDGLIRLGVIDMQAIIMRKPRKREKLLQYHPELKEAFEDDKSGPDQCEADDVGC